MISRRLVAELTDFFKQAHSSRRPIQIYFDGLSRPSGEAVFQKDSCLSVPNLENVTLRSQTTASCGNVIRSNKI